MAKSQFKRIFMNGRWVTISKVVKKHPTTGMTDISVRAKAGHSRVGEVWGTRSTKKKTRFIVGSHINPSFRGKGLGTDLYKELGEAIKANKGRWMVGHTGNSLIKKIRAKVGKTRVMQRKTLDWQVTTDLKAKKGNK